jgi:hypothetical protein
MKIKPKTRIVPGEAEQFAIFISHHGSSACPVLEFFRITISTERIFSHA